MPKIAKRKKQESSEEEKNGSSSDSGPEDRNPPGKGNAGKKSAPTATKSGEEETSWELDRNKMLKVRTFKGKTYVDIREYYEKDGKQLPGKKGISLAPSQWKKLTSLVSEVDKVLEEI